MDGRKSKSAIGPNGKRLMLNDRNEAGRTGSALVVVQEKIRNTAGGSLETRLSHSNNIYEQITGIVKFLR